MSYIRFLGRAALYVRLLGRAVIPSEVLKVPAAIGKQLEGTRLPAGGTFVPASKTDFDQWVRRDEREAPDHPSTEDAPAPPAETAGPGPGKE